MFQMSVTLLRAVLTFESAYEKWLCDSERAVNETVWVYGNRCLCLMVGIGPQRGLCTIK